MKGAEGFELSVKAALLIKEYCLEASRLFYHDQISSSEAALKNLAI